MMSHQTGIQADEQLLSFISQCKRPNNTIRIIKITIKNENLTLDEYKEQSDNWELDYHHHVQNMVVAKKPCYILFKLDTLDSNGTNQWLFISWSPEDSPVREKMLYASTKATLKQQFGANSILHDYFASGLDEVALNAYTNWLKKKKAVDDVCLTRQEEELREVKKQEKEAMSSISKSHNTLPGIEFPIDDEVISAIFDMKQGDLVYIQLMIDVDREEIKLNMKITEDEFEMSKLRSLIPENSPRYHLIVFPHSYEEEFYRSIIFVYSLPGGSCSVKQRMLYSSCKSALLNAIADQEKIGLQIDKKLEIDNPRELTSDFFIEELHPKQNIAKAKFEKPKGPMKSRPGARRLIKTNDDE